MKKPRAVRKWRPTVGDPSILVDDSISDHKLIFADSMMEDSGKRLENVAALFVVAVGVGVRTLRLNIRGMGAPPLWIMRNLILAHASTARKKETEQTRRS